MSLHLYKISTHAQNVNAYFPETRVHSFLDQKLIVVTRHWSGAEHENQVLEEIQRFISSYEADLEVTTPFNYLESLTSLGNKLRIAILLANDSVLNLNKEKTQFGFEIALCYISNREICLCSVGRFSLKYKMDNLEFLAYETGATTDYWTLLPAQLIGIEKEPEIKVTSIAKSSVQSLKLSSFYNPETFWEIEISF